MATMLQPELHSDPLVDIWPLLMTDYSSCALHIINDHQILDIAAIPIPLILSLYIPRRKPFYPLYLLQALTSVQCLLHIVSPVPAATTSYLVDQLDFDLRWQVFKAVYPQTYIIVSMEDYPATFLNYDSYQDIDLRHWPEVFFILPANSVVGERRSFKIKFLCWYCKASAQVSYWRMPLDIFVSSCSIYKSDCDKILKNTVEANLIDFGAHFWFCAVCFVDAEPVDVVRYEPFGKSWTDPEKHLGSLPLFLYGENGTIRKQAEYYFPEIRTRRTAFEAVALRSTCNVHSFGVTPAVKFFTLEDVSDVKLSSNVYFAPFTSAVWGLLLVSVCVTILFEGLLLRTATSGEEGWCSTVYEAFYWKTASLMGQCSSSYPPKLSALCPNQNHQKHRKAITITAVVWVVSSIIIAFNYGAYFSAESIRTFQYKTRFERVVELENFTLFYLLNKQQFDRLCNTRRGTPSCSKNKNMHTSCVLALSKAHECDAAHYIKGKLEHYLDRIYEMEHGCGVRHDDPDNRGAAVCRSVDGVTEVRGHWWLSS